MDKLPESTNIAVSQPDRDVAEAIVGSIRGYGVRLPNDGHFAIQAVARHRAAHVRTLLEDLRLSIECAAGCDEGVDADTASSEVMSFGGSALAAAYDRIVAALAEADMIGAIPPDVRRLVIAARDLMEAGAVALPWAAEHTELVAAAEAFADRIPWLDQPQGDEVAA